MDTRDSQAHLTSLSVKLKELEDKGFNQQFIFVNGALKDQEGNIFQQADLKIVEEYRFEGESDPEDMSILYVVKSQKGTKGTVVAPYGAYTDDTSEFMKDVEEEKE